MDITKYRFRLEATQRIRLTEYKGSAFHGGLGRALHQISPTWYTYFYENEKKASLSLNPYVLLPPLEAKQVYSIGDVFVFDLTLFGDANQHYAICQAAVEYFGNSMGLGYHRGKFKVKDFTSTSFSPASVPDGLNEITLKIPTRLRLKHKNKLCRLAPDFALLVSNLLRRVESLYAQFGKLPPDLPSQKTFIAMAKHVEIKHHNLKWDDWDRFSGSQKKWMKFGGLLGDITYSGDLSPFYEILQLGEWLHIGGKTSFGLGKYTLEIKNA